MLVSILVQMGKQLTPWLIQIHFCLLIKAGKL